MLVVVLANPALPVAGLGLLVIATRLVARRQRLDDVLGVLGVPVLVGLFGIALALGTLGRAWSGPASLLSHLDAVGTAAVAALAAVVVNNLPAAALLAARRPPHPFALLVGSRRRTQPVRHRVPGLDPVVADGTVGRLGAPGPPGGRDRPGLRTAVDGRRTRAAGRHRLAVTARPPGGGQLILRRSTTNTRVSLAAMPAPGEWAPYPRLGGMISSRRPPTCMPATPWSQPGMT